MQFQLHSSISIKAHYKFIHLKYKISNQPHNHILHNSLKTKYLVHFPTSKDSTSIYLYQLYPCCILNLDKSQIWFDFIIIFHHINKEHRNILAQESICDEEELSKSAGKRWRRVLVSFIYRMMEIELRVLTETLFIYSIA